MHSGPSDHCVAGGRVKASDEPRTTYHTHIAGFWYIPTWTSDLRLWWRAQSEADCSGPVHTVLADVLERLIRF